MTAICHIGCAIVIAPASRLGGFALYDSHPYTMHGACPRNMPKEAIRKARGNGIMRWNRMVAKRNHSYVGDLRKYARQAALGVAVDGKRYFYGVHQGTDSRHHAR